MVIPSRNAISSADMSEEKDGVGLKKKKRGETYLVLPTQFISLSKPESRMKKRTNIESVAETPGSTLAGEGVGGGEKANEQEDQLEWRKEEKREEAVGLARRMGKTEGAKAMAGQKQGEVEGRRRHIA